MIGETVNQFKILKKLGEGGMGEVYLAEDTDLNRKVALKFLPPYYSKDPDINARFKREAEAAAALTHPNIITIHEVGEYEGRAFIAMEYVEGSPLSKKIENGELTSARTVEIIMQVCNGLNKAHEAGIVHRDIKPENIILDKDGNVKILDFGLAQKRGASKITKEATTLGTIHYMSPEQCQSGEVDARSDIWSIGVVLYQMITGRLPFQGDYENAITYSIMNEEPEPLARYKSDVSNNLQRLVEKALRKDPETRYQTVADLLGDLKQESKISSSAVQPVVIPKKKVSAKAFALSTGLLLVSAVIILFFFMRPTRQPVTPQATHRQLTYTGNAYSPAISPDGKSMAYVIVQENGEKLMIQDLSGGQPLEVLSGFSYHNRLRWSPDGTEIAIFAWYEENGYGIYLVPRLGGKPRVLLPFPSFSYSPDGSQLAGGWETARRIWFIDKASGDTTSIALERYLLGGVDWSPVGNRLLFLARDDDGRFNVCTIKTDGSEHRSVASDSSSLFSPRWSSDGNTIYVLRDSRETMDLLKIAIDAESGQAKSSSELIETGLVSGRTISISQDNRNIVYSRESSSSNLWLLIREGGTEKDVKAKQLTQGTARVNHPRFSPDGRMIAFRIAQGKRSNIHQVSVQGGQPDQLTFFESSSSWSPVWSPDGTELAFASDQSGFAQVWKVNTSSGTSKLYAKTRLSDNFSLTWFPSSDILYHTPNNRNYRFLDPTTEREWNLVSNDSVGWVFHPHFSPDGRNVAVYWNRRLGEQEDGLWLISLEDSSQTLVSPGWIFPIGWSEGGQYIYAFDEANNIIVVISPKSYSAETLLRLPFKRVRDDAAAERIAITPDGNRIAYSVKETQSDVWLMEDFDLEVK